MSETVQRTPLGQLKAGGPSLNPGGRPASVKHVTDLARQFTVDAILQLKFLMMKGENDYVKLAATQALLDRGWGKPLQSAVLGVGAISTERVAEIKTLVEELRTVTFTRSDNQTPLQIESEAADGGDISSSQ
jgi:hypothetical protein